MITVTAGSRNRKKTEITGIVTLDYSTIYEIPAQSGDCQQRHMHVGDHQILSSHSLMSLKTHTPQGSFFSSHHFHSWSEISAKTITRNIRNS